MFRLRDHIERLFVSAKVFMIDVPYSVDDIVEATRTVVRVNGLDDGLLHPARWSTWATARWD